MKLLSAILIILATACVTPLKKSGSKSNLLFPFATYKQIVDISFLQDKKQTEISFQAILVHTEKLESLVGYNGFGMTLLELYDAPDSSVQFHSPIPQLSEKKEFFIKIYHSVKKILYLKANYRPEDLHTIESEVDANIVINRDLESNSVKSLILKKAGYFDITITNKKIDFN